MIHSVRARAAARRPTLIALPDVRQATSYTCGAASLLSILAYYGWKGGDPNERDLARELGTTARNGTEPGDIARISNKHGVKAEVRRDMTLDDVIRAVRHGRPVMVAYQAYAADANKKPWREIWDDGHWSNVIGVDDRNVYLEDPSMLGKRGVIPRAEFLERWHDTDRANRHVYQHLGIVFSSDTPRRALNTVSVTHFEYVP